LGYIPTLCQVFEHVAPPADIVDGKMVSKIQAGNYVIVD
jgi:hypothetical protein